MNLKKMTIQELKDKKEKLEKVINGYIHEFESETGVIVDGVYLSRQMPAINNAYLLSSTEKDGSFPEICVRIEI